MPPPQSLGIGNAVFTMFLATVGYFVAAFAFLIVQRVASLPQGELWEESGFHGPLLYGLVAGAIGLLSVPYWNREWDSSLRALSFFSSVLLFAYAFFQATGILDPNIPLHAFMHYLVQPVRTQLRF